MDEAAVATLEGCNQLYVEVRADPGDTYASLAARHAGSARDAAAIARVNAGRAVAPGLYYAIPFTIVSGSGRARALAALFPGDAPTEEGWVHRVPEDDAGQTLESIALWFTGDPSLADDLAESNGIEWQPLPSGTEVTVPESLLAPELSSPPPEPAVPPVETPGPPPPPAPAAPAPIRVGELTFVEGDGDGHALYRLKRGEALYTAVVVRFTGRLDPEEVNAVAAEIASLSGIKNMRSIPTGRRIVIPRRLVLPEYLPPGDPQRAAYEAGLAAANRHRLVARSRDLSGVTVILDAGHGGDDVGARRNGVHEDDYVYDILCRLKALVEKSTGARVETTIKDESSGYGPLEGPFAIDRDEVLLTTPSYRPRQPHVGTAGVNLRWYLVNARYRAALARGADAERVVFLSLHADSLHPSVRGMMVYVPGQAYRTGTYGHVGPLYQRSEVEELRYVRFSENERERAEGLSRRLARRLVQAFRGAALPVHAYEPVRDHVIRRGRSWSPAVIRSSLVPQSLLVEVVNLANKRDAALIRTAPYRQQVATAILAALRAHYGEEGASASVASR